ncbi:MAG: PadR family transcriptional regulator [Promethearchaeota archaeon]|nr:MAG: PadR family transcriptional regulator [Candidatus Lokiarchaeota archaeon]
MNENDEIKINSLTRLYILVLLKSDTKVTGYSILKRLDKDLGKTASPTYVYDFLKQLKSNGYIEDIPNPKSKRKSGVTLTNSGEDFIDKIFLRFYNLIDVAIQSKLTVCASCGAKLYEDFHTEKINGKEMNFCCKHCAKAYNKLIHNT